MLIVFEGIHGCGKSTQINKLKEWINRNYKIPVVVSSWNSYEVLYQFNDDLKGKKLHTPLSYSLVHALDLHLRYKHIIEPSLEMKHIVLVDRYYYTGYVKDHIRNVSMDLLTELYSFCPEPDLVFFFQIDPQTALCRMKDIEYRSEYVLGLDLKYSCNKRENFLRFLEKQNIEYMNIFRKEKDNVCIIDANSNEDIQFKQVLAKFIGRCNETENNDSCKLRLMLDS